MSFANDLYTIIQKRVAKNYMYGHTPVYNLTISDAQALEAVANKYGFVPQWLANLINFESGGTFNPAIQNSIGATGLIQFLPSTAISLGTTADALKQMSFKEQLWYVDKYLQVNMNLEVAAAGLYNKQTGKVTKEFTQTDLFMIIFYPVAVGKRNYVFPAAVTKANPGIKTPQDYAFKAIAAAPFKDIKTYTDYAEDIVERNKLPFVLGTILVLATVTGVIWYQVKK